MVMLDQRGLLRRSAVAAANDAYTAGGGNVLQFSEEILPLLSIMHDIGDAESTAVNRVEVVLAGSGSGEQLNFSDTSKIEGSWRVERDLWQSLVSRRQMLAQSAIRTITYSNSDTSN